MRSVTGRLGDELRRDMRAIGALLAPPLCEACGRRTVRPAPVCAACRGSLRPAEPAIRVGLANVAAFRYEGRVARKIVHRFKYRGARQLAEFLAGEMAGALARAGLFGAWLVPVPAAPDRLRLRGYDQAARLASRLGVRAELPVVGALRQRQSVPSQTGLGAGARLANVADVFEALAIDPGPPVLLVDDVVTTGATLASCRVALARRGHPVVGSVVAFRAEVPAAGNEVRPGFIQRVKGDPGECFERS